MVEQKDVILALLGVSAGVAGLVLVFLGLVVGAVSGFAPGTSAEVLAPIRRPALTTLVAFASSLLCTVLATVWLLACQPQALYVSVVSVFFVQVALVAAAAAHVFFTIIWSD